MGYIIPNLGDPPGMRRLANGTWILLGQPEQMAQLRRPFEATQALRSRVERTLECRDPSFPAWTCYQRERLAINRAMHALTGHLPPPPNISHERDNSKTVVSWYRDMTEAAPDTSAPPVDLVQAARVAGMLDDAQRASGASSPRTRDGPKNNRAAQDLWSVQTEFPTAPGGKFPLPAEPAWWRTTSGPSTQLPQLRPLLGP